MDHTSMTDLFADHLRLCGVDSTTTLGVLSQGNVRLDYADAYLAAARRLGATSMHVRVSEPPVSGGWTVGRTGVTGNDAAVQALAGCDLVVDLVFLLFSPEQFALQDTGTRIVTVVEPIELLARLFPTPELRATVEKAAERLSAASRMHITSGAGTDVVYQLGHYPTLSEYGYTDTPGRWDHWPAAFVFTGASDTGVDGRIVLAPGDVLLPFNSYVTDRVELVIERGFITAITGGLEADLIRSYIESFDDPRGYGMSHVGWGLDPRAHWHGLTAGFTGGMGMELRSFLGNVMFSIGPNNELGGPNDTACHLDIPMRNCTLRLDDDIVVDAGKVVP